MFLKAKILPLVYIKDAVIFPDVIAEITVGSRKCKEAVDTAGRGGSVLVVTQKNPNIDLPSEKELFSVGVIGKVQQIIGYDGVYKIYFNAEKRAKIEKFKTTEPLYEAEFSEIKDDKLLDEEGQAIYNVFSQKIKELVNSQKALPLEAVIKIFSLSDPNQLINNIISFLNASILEKQAILETVDLKERLRKSTALVNKALEISGLEEKVSKQTQEELTKAQKELYLREELKTIQKELGEEGESEYEEIKRKGIIANLPPTVSDVLNKELSRLKKTPSFSPEAPYIRNYIDLLLDLPWKNSKGTEIDIKKAREILDKRHYGLGKVKERILEYLAISKLAHQIKAPILCFVGPPGTGKTSIGQSIAEALNKKFVRISLGGIRDEAEIKGHRRTYVGAMPGRIIQGMKNTQSKDPVFMLDEIDKVGSDYRGDPSASLLEVLDPEQNKNFSDHYLEIPYDLSRVFFITTANVLETIPRALLDRMEIIEFSGYTALEKYHIARKYIIPKITETHGLSKDDFIISDEGLYEIIERYTHEAGVRNLEREISKLARKVAIKIVEKKPIPREIGKNEIEELIGSPKADLWVREVKSQVGLVAALAVTEAGGEVLSVESTLMPGGKGNLVLTGQLGDVMKESAQTALSYARSISPKLKIDPPIDFNRNDIHIHVPAGAIKKDGPSAGAAIALAIISILSKKQIDNEMGMTGEITLRGRVLKIGGLKEKILAAKRAGLKKVIYPKSNFGDFKEINKDDLEGINFFPVENMDEVMAIALGTD